MHKQTTFNALACWCQALGLGDQCCEGPDAQITLIGLTEEDDGSRQAKPSAQQKIEQEYKANMCHSLVAVFAKVPSPQDLEGPMLTAAPSAKVPTKRTESPTAVNVPMPAATTSKEASVAPTWVSTKTPTATTVSTTLPSLLSSDIGASPEPNPSLSPTYTENPSATETFSRDPDSSAGAELEAETLTPFETLGITLAAALVGFSVGLAFFSQRKRNKDNDPSLDDVTNKDLETGDHAAGVPDNGVDNNRKKEAKGLVSSSDGNRLGIEQRDCQAIPSSLAIAMSSTFIGNHHVSQASLAKISEDSIPSDDEEEDKPIRKLTRTEENAKEKKKKQEIIELLVSETMCTNPGITAAQLIAAYDENEDELINNLTKIKTKNKIMQK